MDRSPWISLPVSAEASENPELSRQSCTRRVSRAESLWSIVCRLCWLLRTDPQCKPVRHPANCLPTLRNWLVLLQQKKIELGTIKANVSSALADLSYKFHMLHARMQVIFFYKKTAKSDILH